MTTTFCTPNGVGYLVTYCHNAEAGQPETGNDVALIDRVQLASPTGLVASAVSAWEIALNWTDQSAEETGFRIERSANGTSGWTHVATAAADASGYVDAGLRDGALWYYRVRATSSVGLSEYSNTSSARTPVAAPTDLAVTSISGSEVALTWQDNSGKRG